MRKMRLQLESLAVETFDTGPDRALGRGTVRGQEDTMEPAVSDAGTCRCPDTTLGQPTVNQASCGHTYCNQMTCGCQPPTQFDPTCAAPSCGLTYCVDTCDYCMSRVTDSPERC